MINSRLCLAGAVAAFVLAAHPLASLAQDQQSPGWFVPGQQRPAPSAPGRPAARPAAGAVANGVADPGGDDQQGATQQVQVQLPPAPDIPAVAKGPPTPSAIVGILSIPDALRASTAYQQADKVFNDRGKKLSEDQQKEDGALRDLQQQFMAERTKMSPEQQHQKEKEIQDRFAESRRKFGERGRVIQAAGQYVIAQINRTMGQVVQQVAQARGVNVVLNQSPIVYVTTDFDLTPQVVEVLNKVLPAVVIPPDGVSPVSMATPKAEPGAAAPVAAAEQATPPAKPVPPVKAPPASTPPKH